MDHKFGGNWTEKKLRIVKKYLEAYSTIFTQNERAAWFNNYYVDAFAGTGDYRHSIEEENSLGLDLDGKAEIFFKGSTKPVQDKLEETVRATSFE